MAADGEIRYAKTHDGLNIAYTVFGDGPLTLLLCPGFVSHLELWMELPTMLDVYRRFGSFSRYVAFDKRGTGLSDRVSGAATFEERAEDITAVLDAVGAEQAALLGISEGGALALTFAATHRERVTQLVLWGTAPCFPPAGHEGDLPDDIPQLIEDRWGTGAVWPLFVDGLAETAGPDFAARWERMAASPGAARALIQQNLEGDIRGIVGSVTAPSVVIHRTDDPIVHIDGGRWLADHLPVATFHELPGNWHYSVRPGAEDDAIDLVEEFLTGRTDHHEPDRVLTTVLFTDIVDSTRHAAELGDRQWSAVLDTHDRHVAEIVGRHQGRVVKHTGDGVFATFDGPAKAVRCAHAIIDACRGAGLDLRAGVHTGECELRGDDLGGLGVHIGARIGALAGPGEVLASATVKGLVAGSGLVFTDRGIHTLKGVPDEWPLYAVTTT